jgi:hypothetical protein
VEVQALNITLFGVFCPSFFNLTKLSSDAFYFSDGFGGFRGLKSAASFL